MFFVREDILRKHDALPGRHAASFWTYVAAAVLALAASAAAKCDAGGMPDADRIELEGDYAGHLQDVWWDGGTNLWWAHTHQILRTDLAGKVVARADVDGHNAGCEVKDGVLYVAVKLGIETIKCRDGELFLSMYNGKNGLLVVLDAKTFAEKRRQAYNGTTGLLFDGRFAWCGQTRRNAKSGRYESALVRCKAPEGVR